jgi:hypothetical protein
MASTTIGNLLDQLEMAKRRFDGDGPAQTLKLLERLSRSRFQDAASLIRFHEILLFIRAYPASNEIREKSEALLDSFVERVERLREAGEDLAQFWDAEFSGIVATEISAVFSYKVARWLAQRFPKTAEVDWEAYKRKDRLGAVLPRLIPLLDEDSSVEANVPFRDWLGAAKDNRLSDLAWIIRNFDEMDLSERAKAELYDSLDLPIWWRIENSSYSRTHLRLATKTAFYHTTSLIKRSEVSIAEAFSSKPIRLRKLSPKQGEQAIELARAASVARYRELYGFTHGDASRVLKADLGRGVEMFVYELPRDWRLPLRAYHAGMIFKNGVPVGYVETLSLFERCEVGFNLYYTFREGETAWLYARLLKLFHQHLGANYFSIDPYQIGFHNEEAIDSGAFWFYRKLGYRPTQETIRQVVEAEEKRLATRPGYRTAARTLRKIAEGHIVFELGRRRSDWDGFQIRRVGLALQKRLAEEFGGSIKKMKADAVKQISRTLNIEYASLNPAEQRQFENFAYLLSLVKDLGEWTRPEKQLAAQILEAKMHASETEYLAALQKHERLRRAVIEMGT